MPEGDTPLKHQYYKTGREKKQIGSVKTENNNLFLSLTVKHLPGMFQLYAGQNLWRQALNMPSNAKPLQPVSKLRRTYGLYVDPVLFVFL